MINILSWILSLYFFCFSSHFLFEDPFKGTIPNQSEIESLYKTLIADFKNNTLDLLETITHQCTDIMQRCKAGISGYLFDCCSDISPPIYVNKHKCFIIKNIPRLDGIGNMHSFWIELRMNLNTKPIMNPNIASILGTITNLFENPI